jgi:short-subunit dehydrogenase
MGLPPPSADSTALVTGASAGIGEAIARELAGRGHGVTLVARREERLRELAGELSDAHDVRAEAVAADLADPRERDKLEAAVRRAGLTVEILVNNAGFGAFGFFAKADRERQVEMVRLNVEAVVDLEARYLPGMVDRGRGAVINIASTSAFQPLPTMATYSAGKAFVLAHSEAVHTELRGTGVTVTAVCPGPVKTEFTEAAGHAGMEDRTPGMFWMSAEEVAEQAVSAAAKGKRSVIPGLMNHAGAIAGRHTPRTFALPALRRFSRRVF